MINDFVIFFIIVNVIFLFINMFIFFKHKKQNNIFEEEKQYFLKETENLEEEIVKGKQFFHEQSDILLEIVSFYLEHLEKINSSDVLYGDPMIVSLVEHTKELIEDIKVYKKMLFNVKEEGILKKDE
jgi:hypothetical protein